MSSESVCFYRVSECPQRQCVSSESVSVLRDSETVSVLRDSETVTSTSWDSNVSHQEASSLPLVLFVNNRFRSLGPELFITLL